MRSVIIIGAGPAGLTAGIYLGRANLKPLILTGAMPGGQLTTTTEIENFPGFSHGTPGPKLMEEMEEQARRSGAEVRYDAVTKIETGQGGQGGEGGQGDPAVLIEDERLEAHAIIGATGASPRTLGIPGEKEFWSAGVHTCAVCDGGFYRNKEVAVVGGGDSAMEEAAYLAKICSRVHVIHRRDQFRASKVMQKRVLENPVIQVHWNSIPADVLGEADGMRKKVTSIRLKNTQTGELTSLKADACFMAIGHIPSTELFKGVVELDEEGYIKVDSRLRTSAARIFAAGDIHDRRYRQAITAAGFGCQAAIEVERMLTEEGLI